MAHPILHRLARGEVLLSDGAMGTELQKRGLKQGECPEALNVNNPEIVLSIHRDYYQAGADIVETNSFGGNRARLQMFGLENHVHDFNRKAAELARSVCPPNRYVAGSIGPTGELLEPFGTLSIAQAKDYFKEQAEALAEGGVDIFFVETMSTLEEIGAAVEAIKQISNLPVAASMTYEMSETGVHTSWGVDVPSAVRFLEEAGADIIGANCGNGIDVILAVIREMRPLTTLPLLAQPNAGLPQIEGNLIVYRETPESIKDKYLELLDLQIGILGGCCGTNPAHVQLMRQLIDQRNKK